MGQVSRRVKGGKDRGTGRIIQGLTKENSVGRSCENTSYVYGANSKKPLYAWEHQFTMKRVQAV